MTVTPAVHVSLAVATARGWPEVVDCVRALEVATASVQGELLVADSSGRPPPPAALLARTTRWLTFPRASVFSTRPQLLRACQGEIICLTEDHALVAPTWAVALRDLHEQFPDALSIGGPVDNSADEHPVDWASYFVVHPGFMPPIEAGARDHLTHGNVSYKRGALERMEPVPGLGMPDIFHQRSLARTNGAIRIDPAPMVWHHQVRSPAYFVRQHFHAARSHSGLVRASGTPLRRYRLAAAPVIPFIRFARVTCAARRSNHPDKVLAAMPWMLLLLFSQVAGQTAGLLFGAGDSPIHVEG